MNRYQPANLGRAPLPGRGDRCPCPPVTISGRKPGVQERHRGKGGGRQPCHCSATLALGRHTPARAEDGRNRPGRRGSAAAAALRSGAPMLTASAGSLPPVRPCPTSISTTAPSGRSALAATARASRPASLSTTTATSAPRSRPPRAEALDRRGAVTGEVFEARRRPAAQPSPPPHARWRSTEPTAPASGCAAPDRRAFVRLDSRSRSWRP